jgi:hypothetical protein
MSFSLIDLECEQHRVVRSPESISRLLEMQRHPAGSSFAAFSNWVEVKRWVDREGIWRESADPLLRPMVAAYQQCDAPAWSEILLYLFWRPLARVHRLLAACDPDPTCRYSQVFWAFTMALRRIDLDKRTCRLGSKVIQDMRHDVRHAYDLERARARRIAYLDDEAFGDCGHESTMSALRVQDTGFASVEYRHDTSWAIAQLKAHVRSGHLTHTDFLILVGCHLYGRTLDEMAARQGLNYDAVKKRRQRAVSLLKKTAPELSPDLPNTPLMSLSRAPRKEKSHVREL